MCQATGGTRPVSGSRLNRQEILVLLTAALLEIGGEDVRREPLEERKTRLTKLLRRSADGIRLNEHMASDGALIFKHACKLGLEGIVSKRRDMGYRSGRVKS